MQLFVYISSNPEVVSPLMSELLSKGIHGATSVDCKAEIDQRFQRRAASGVRFAAQIHQSGLSVRQDGLYRAQGRGDPGGEGGRA